MMYEEQMSYLHIQLKNNLTGYFLMCLILLPVFSAQLSSDVEQFYKARSNTSKKAIKQNTTEQPTFIQYKPQAVSGWECNCWNATHEFKVSTKFKKKNNCSDQSIGKYNKEQLDTLLTNAHLWYRPSDNYVFLFHAI